MSRFNVGDRLVRKSYESRYTHESGVVSSVKRNQDPMYDEITFEGVAGFWFAHRFDLVKRPKAVKPKTPAAPFKVGDKVKRNPVQRDGVSLDCVPEGGIVTSVS